MPITRTYVPSLPKAMTSKVLLELEVIQTQMAEKPMPRAEVYARALRASENLKRAEKRKF
jgi:hypothetical protein